MINKKRLSILLSFLLLFQFALPFAQAADIDLNQVTTDTVQSYYQIERSKNLTTFWETAALYAASENLTDGTWLPPNITTDESADAREIAGYILNQCFLGTAPTEMAQALAARQKNDGSLDNTLLGHTWATLALKAAGAEFDTKKATDYLLSMQLADGGFSLSSFSSTGDCDTTAMAALALSPYINEHQSATLTGFFKNRQNSATGGFDGQMGPNSNSTAMVISALVSLGENIYLWSKNGKTPVDDLLSYRTQNHGFGFTDSVSVNAMATAQALIALCDAVQGNSVFHTIANKNQKIINILIQTPDKVLANLRNFGVDVFDLSVFTESSPSSEVALHGLIKALDIADAGIKDTLALENGILIGLDGLQANGNARWLTYINHQICQSPLDQITLQNHDTLAIFFTHDYTAGTYSYFDNSVLEAETGEEIVLTLMGRNIKEDVLGIGGFSAPIGNVQLTINHNSDFDEEDSIFSNYEGKATLYFSQPGDYSVGVLLYDSNQEKDVSLAHCLLLIKGEPVPPQSRTVQVRIEGLRQTILPLTEVTITKNRIPTAMDALKEVLTLHSIDYEAPGGSFVHRIANEASNQIPGEAYNGWLYMVNDVSSVYAMNEHRLYDSDVITLYYGGLDTVIPRVTIIPSPLYSDDEIGVHVDCIYTDWSDWNNPVERTKNIENAKITLNQSSYLTDEYGEVTIADPLQAGTYELSVSKEVEGSFPAIVRNTLLLYVKDKNDNNEEYPGSGGSGNHGNTNKVTLTVVGNDGNIFYPNLSKGETETVVLQTNDTPYSILKRQLGDRVKTSGKGDSIYVLEIDGLKEFDITPESGWMYSVNGEFEQHSANTRKLKNGDKVKWVYTLNLGEDVGDNTPKNNSGNSRAVIKANVDLPILADVEKTLNKLLDVIKEKEELEEFDIFILARNGIHSDNPVYAETIINIIEQSQGMLRKSTDLSKLILAAHTIGLDAKSIAGYDLISQLVGFENITNQGTNAPAYALVVYEALGLKPEGEAVNSIESCISYILDNQNPDGGIALAKEGRSDVDITAMALYALAPHQHLPKVKECIEKALGYLSTVQLPNGGFSYDDTESSESVSQTILALTALEIDVKDERFVKANGNLYTNLLSFQSSTGHFKHLKNADIDDMATQQAAMALTAYKRYLSGMSPLFQLSKNHDIRNVFTDIHTVPWAQSEIMNLYEKGIIQGVDRNHFAPDDSVTREQFIKMLAVAFDFGEQASEPNFYDISPEHWSLPYVNAAYSVGIVKGKADGSFGLGQELSRQDMCVLLLRTLQLKNIGLLDRDKSVDELFADSLQIEFYARESIAALYKNNIIYGVDFNLFAPSKNCTRAEAAVVLVRSLQIS